MSRLSKKEKHETPQIMPMEWAILLVILVLALGIYFQW
jgi:hypothetical protein